jgi:nitrate reductase delta subunit
MIKSVSATLDSFSNLLNYPSDELFQQVDDCVNLLKLNKSSALKSVEIFSDFVKKSSVDNLQEYYTRTFEINPTCALEVGWHLFGERYERGTFIVKMRQTLRQYCLPESTELPDHLYHVLRALAQMPYDEADEVSNLFLLPAIKKMLEGFKGKENVYAHVLKGIQCEIENHYTQSTQGVSHE